MPAVPYLVRADLDKPHRCPSCYRSGASKVTGWTVRPWHAYTCPHCGQRFARRLFLPVHPEGFHYSRRVRLEVWVRHWFTNPASQVWLLHIKPWTYTLFWHRYPGYLVCGWRGHSRARWLNQGSEHTYFGCVRCRCEFEQDH